MKTPLHYLRIRNANKHASPWSRLVGFLLLTAVLAGCTVSLAPKFDQRIIDNLSSSSEETFQLLSEVSAGTTNADFVKREERYNNLIGTMEALQLQINARPLPKNRISEKIISKANRRIGQRKGMDSLLPPGANSLLTVSETAPSATAVAQIVKILNQMKTADQRQGLSAAEVRVSKGFVTLYMDQALTYEKFLNN